MFEIKPALSELSPKTEIEAIIPVIKGAIEHPTSPNIAIEPYIAPLPFGKSFAAI